MNRIRERVSGVVTGGASTPASLSVERAPTAHSNGRRALQWAVIAAPLVLLAAVGFAHRWIYDDGWIYLRVVKQIRVGHGPVFNTGQRVEAFTSPMWTAILAVADLLLPISLEWLAVLLGIAATVAGAGFAMRGAALIARRVSADAFLLPVGILVFAALVPVWYFETAGLETGLTFFWFGLSFWLLAKWAGESDATLSRTAAIVLGLGWVIRPELVVASAVFLVIVSAAQWRDTTWRQRIELAVFMLAVPVAYEVFRMGYYGLLVSSTAVAKEGSRLRVGTGWQYLLDFVEPYGLWLPIALLLLAVYLPLACQLRVRREARSVYVLGAFVVSALGCAAGVVGFGGDYIHGRLLLPAFFALCAPAAVIPLTKRYAMLFVVVAWAAVCGVALRPRELKHVYNVRQGILYSLPITNCCGDISLDSLGWGPRSPHRVAFDGGGVFVSETTNKRQFGFVYTEVTTPLKPDIHLPTIASGGIGILSYALGPRVSVLDLNGLADTTAAHLALVRRGYPGHEKALPGPWVAAMLTADGTQPIPDEFQIASEPTTPPDPNLPFEQQVTLARQALQCGALRDLQRSTEKHLTIGLFLSNVLHARSRTALRIPSNPRDAEVRFCGDTSRHVAARSVLASTVARATVTDCRSRPYCRANDQRTSPRSASVVLPARTRVADVARGPP